MGRLLSSLEQKNAARYREYVCVCTSVYVYVTHSFLAAAVVVVKLSLKVRHSTDELLHSHKTMDIINHCYFKLH